MPSLTWSKTLTCAKTTIKFIKRNDLEASGMPVTSLLLHGMNKPQKLAKKIERSAGEVLEENGIIGHRKWRNKHQ